MDNFAVHATAQAEMVDVAHQYKKLKKYVNPEDVLIISEGRNGMPAFEERLSKEEIESVYSYIREVL